MSNLCKRMKPLLGTFVEISAAVDLSPAFSVIAKVQELLSRQDVGSELSLINSGDISRFDDSFWIGESYHQITKLALRLARDMKIASRGLFDPIVDGKISLDGIAKGLAVDLAVRELKKMGAVSGWVNAGGDLRVFGDIELPVERRGSSGIFRGVLKNSAMATSEGCNILQSSGTWSVLAPYTWLADALTKVACLAKPVERAELVQQLGGRLLSPVGEVL